MEKEELAQQIESILFSAGKKISVGDISKLCKKKEEFVLEALSILKDKYANSDSSLMIDQENEFWKLTVREKFMPLVQNIVVETELPKTIMETLAVIAFKHPILQADLTKIRGSSAYEHLKILEEAGFIARERFGRTRKIKLTQKFFDYFDLPPEKVKDAFAGFDAVEKAIAEKEQEAGLMIAEIQKRKQEDKKKSEAEKEKMGEMTVYEEAVPEDAVMDPEELETPEIEVYDSGEKLGKLKVTKEKPEKEKKTEKKVDIEKTETSKDEEIKDDEEKEDNKEIEDEEEKPKEIKEMSVEDIKKKFLKEEEMKKDDKPSSYEDEIVEKIEKKIDEKVDKIMNPKQEEDKKEKEEKSGLDEMYEEIEESKRDLEKKS